MIILGTNSIKETGFNVDNSCRFESAQLLRTNTSASATNIDKYTVSVWVKRSKLGVDSNIIADTSGSSEYYQIYFKSDDTIRWQEYHASGESGALITNRKFRDVSAWYHIVCRYDSSLGTAGDRMRMYVNGVEETSFATDVNPAQDANGHFGESSSQKCIADNNSDAREYFGYMCEFMGVDGQSLAPTEFGEFDEDSGIWKPIDISGITQGVHGFYLKFEDSSDLGVATLGSNWTGAGLAATDQSLDTCTNNHAVGNPLLNYNPQLTEGNLVLTSSGTAWKNSMSTIGVTSGIWYYEVKITAESAVPYGLIGVTDSYHPNSWGASPPNYLGIGALQIGYYNDNGTYYQNDGQQSYSGNGFGVNDTIGVLLNLDAGTPTIKFYKNDADQGAINLPTNSNSTGLWFFMQSMYISTCSVNYGSPTHAISSGNQDGNGWGNFEYATKGGYALNTKNLAEFGG